MTLRLQRIHCDWQIWLIGLSAVIGALIAFNSTAAVLELSLVLVGILLYFIMANLPDPLSLRHQLRAVLSGILILLPSIIATHFLLTNDWSRWAGKLAILTPLATALANEQLGLSQLALNPNVVGGALAALLPLQVFALRHTRRWVSAISIGLTIVALVLSQTRGAWLALIVAVGAWGVWKMISTRVSNLRQARWFWVGILIVGGIAALSTLILTPLGEQLLGLGGDRRYIWRNSLDLVTDYPLTGLGLAGFEMTYSTYVLLTHVGHTVHAHNLWLDIWLNQGLLGVVALAGMVLNAVWPKPSSQWRTPALIALGVILLHSLVDDPIYGYGGAAIPLIFVPLGLLARRADPSVINERTATLRFQPAFLIWGLTFGVIILGIVAPRGRAIFEANLGALQQTQAELSVYHWPEVPIQDALRRSDAIDLSPAREHFQTALALDPGNGTANRRLAQIELDQGAYDIACRRLAVAYATDPYQRATRQLLGECEVLADQPDEALNLWRTIDLSQGQLTVRQYWYDEYLQDHMRADKLKLAARVLAGE